MRYYIVLSCGHGATIHRKVFSPRVGDLLKCFLCRDRPYCKIVAITDKQETEDGKTYNG